MPEDFSLESQTGAPGGPDLGSLGWQTPDALMLFGFWYRALPSNQLRRGESAKSMLLEQPLVIGRDQQRPALRPARRLPTSRHAAILRRV